jgi:hypothetical protein
MQIREKRPLALDLSKAQKLLETKGADHIRKYYEALAGSIDGVLFVPDVSNAIYARFTGSVESMLVRCNVASPLDALQVNAPIEIYYSKKNNCWVWDGRMPIVAYDIANSGNLPATLLSQATYIIKSSLAGLPNAQVLDDLDAGVLLNGSDGTLSSLLATLGIGYYVRSNGTSWLASAFNVSDIPDSSIPATKLSGMPGFFADSLIVGSSSFGFSARRIEINTVDPTTADDASAGFGYFSLWVNDTDGSIWICRDPTTGLAIWRKIYPASVSGDITVDDIDAASLTVSGSVIADQITASSANISDLEADAFDATNAAIQELVITGSLQLNNIMGAPAADGELAYNDNTFKAQADGLVGSFPILIHANNADVARTNTISVASLQTATPSIAADALNAGTHLHGRAVGALVNQNGAARNFEFNLRIAGNLVGQLVYNQAVVAGVGFWLDWELDVRNLGSSANVAGHLSLMVNGVQSGYTFINSTINTTVANSVDLQGGWQAYNGSFSTLSALVYGLRIVRFN